MVAAASHNETIDVDQAVRLAYASQKAIAEFESLPACLQLQHGEAFWAAMLRARDALEQAMAVLSAEAREQIQQLAESYRWN